MSLMLRMSYLTLSLGDAYPGCGIVLLIVWLFDLNNDFERFVVLQLFNTSLSSRPILNEVTTARLNIMYPYMKFPRVPDLQVRCSDLNKWLGASLVAPITGAKETYLIQMSEFGIAFRMLNFSSTNSV